MSRYDETLCKRCEVNEYDGEDELCLDCRSAEHDHIYEVVKDKTMNSNSEKWQLRKDTNEKPDRK